MYDVISVGDCCQDIFLVMDPSSAHVYCELNKQDCELCFHYADKIPVSQKFDTVGGNAANAAVSFARLGLKTAIYTHIGSDPAGQRISSQFVESGISTDYVVTDSNQETNYNTVISLSGERTILAYHQHRVYRLPRLEHAKWLYLTSMKDGFADLIPDLLTYIQQSGARLCYQPGTFQLKNPELSADLLGVCELLVMNKDEAYRYLGVENQPIESLVKAFHSRGVRQVVITDGGEGAHASNGSELFFLGTLEGVERLEATGAGDAFTSGVMSALVSGESLPQAMRWGLMQASSVIQFVGAQAGLLSKPQLLEQLELHRTIVPTQIATLDKEGR